MNGDAVSFKPFFKGSITKDNERDAFEWLENNNLGDIIKKHCFNKVWERG